MAGATVRTPRSTQRVLHDMTVSERVAGGQSMGTQLGKRYVCEVWGTEVLCTKAGTGVLT